MHKSTHFAPYDILQINRGAPDVWVDFATLRDQRDFDDAARILRRGFPDAPGAKFRIWRGFPLNSVVA